MSLHIGNLSSRTRRDELERIFQRFGRCDVRMKNGYGFVVFEFPPNAEKALRALRNRSICGEPLTLTWSNKQPRPFKRFSRASRTYEPGHGRDSVRGGDHVKIKSGSNERHDYSRVIMQSDGNGGKPSSVDMLDEETAYHQDEIRDYIGEEPHVYGKDFLDEGGMVETNTVDNVRWDEQFRDPSKEIGIEFDRYEPYHGNDGKIDDENRQIAYTDGFPAPGSSEDNIGRDGIGEETLNHSRETKSQDTFKCGSSGHKMRNCPQESSSRRKFSRFDCRYRDDIKGRSKGKSNHRGLGSRSWERTLSNRDAIRTRRLNHDKKSSGSLKISPDVKETDRSKKINDGGRKLSRGEIGYPKMHRTKKPRRSALSPLHSDFTASGWQSTSKSSKQVQRSHSCSRSLSSGACRPSPSSNSSSTSRCSTPKSSKSRSRSSSPTPLSLSVSLGRPLEYSSNKAQVNLKGSLKNARTPESKEFLIEQGQLGEGDTGLDYANLENKMATKSIRDATAFSKAENEMEAGNRLLMDNGECQVTSMSLLDVTNPVPLVEKGTFASESSSLEMLIDINCQNSDALMMEHAPISIKVPDSEAPVGFCPGHSTSISSEELLMVLKHYGFSLQDENEVNLPPEAYFGSARLWPWEIIFYRRLKKGPISIENYARRLDQNGEFGIVDKYIRSSSGWGELGSQENF